ncbi:MAG: hypothetical protein RJA34_2791 [Pseudomonadota bacterium]|jgi:LPS-assembly protein
MRSTPPAFEPEAKLSRLPFWRSGLLASLASVLFAMLVAPSSRAQAVDANDDTPLQLKSTPRLQERMAEPLREQLPTYVFGDRTYGRPDLETVVEGQAELRRNDTVIRANKLTYLQAEDQASAEGQVRINRGGNVFEGPHLQLKVDAFEGHFDKPSYQFLRNDAHGAADRVDFLDASRSVIQNATYTTCRRLPGPSWMPDWILRATELRLDQDQNEGEAVGALLSFKGLPVLPIPYLNFPLSDQRKSGFLPPTLGVDNVGGVQIEQPYYWNIAPNRDATLSPKLMTKRGVDLGAQFRYLEPSYSGELSGNYMPADQLRDADRWGLVALHRGFVNTDLLGRVNVNLNLNHVSDDNYWRDFSGARPTLSQRLLPTDMTANWAGGGLSYTVRTLKWQTLQDVSAPIVPPYDRLPQVVAQYARSDLQGFDVSVVGDLTRFQSDPYRTGQPNAQRAYALAQVSRPFVGAAGFVTPKMQLHVAQYEFDGYASGGGSSASRAVPTFSLDSGLVFERDTSWMGTSMIQTLEPRAFYVNTPFRDQSGLPNYDSGAFDFNFATIYSENAFAGNDRISDSNLLTLGVTSRLLEPDTGAEAARFGVAQRLRFKNQDVTLPGGSIVEDRLSDVILGGTVNLSRQWLADGTVQYNPKTRTSERATLAARYNPGHYRVINTAYRLQKGSSEQIDVGWQWPINDLWGDKGQDLGAGRGQGAGRWYSVGRLNYSLREGRLVDSILGLEYDAACWLGRVVLERLQTSTSSANQRIMFQLEFVGFSRLGVSPLQTLKDNIQRYEYLRDQSSAPSRFSNYE